MDDSDIYWLAFISLGAVLCCVACLIIAICNIF